MGQIGVDGVRAEKLQILPATLGATRSRQAQRSESTAQQSRRRILRARSEYDRQVPKVVHRCLFAGKVFTHMYNITWVFYFWLTIVCSTD